MPFPKRPLWPTRLAAFVALAAALASTCGPSQAQNILPSHGVVTSGAASIGQAGANMTVNQTSSRAIVNWGSFSIGQGAGVTFNQPSSSSAILNRVTGSTTSTIAGQLQANGQVYLVNPNGIAITKTGAVQVGGGFVASRLGIADDDFNNGSLNFVGKGASAGASNAGSIAAAPGGFVGLLGGTVANSGVVSVPLGKVAMGSGEQATLNLTGDNFLQVAVPTNTKTADGQALIDVSGKVRAAGGSVQLRAATVAQAIRNAVNVPGELSVTSARASGGSIILGGGPGGDISVTGRLKASGRTAGGTIAVGGHDVALRQAKLAAGSAKGRGGTVTLTGTRAVSLASSLVYASGATGGGAIRIGGDFHGASDLTSAQTTIDSTSTLNASATPSGDGGTVAVWSDATTNFAGRITATGGASGGDGGSVEVSANPATHGVLDFTGWADLTAAKGKTGTLLLDPFDIVISTAPDSGGSFMMPNLENIDYAPTATSVINTTTLETQLANANVTISTGLTGSPGADAGNITISSPVRWTTTNALTLTAENGIFVNSAINGGGTFSLTGASVAINAPISTANVFVTGAATLGANLTTPGAVEFENSVTSSANTTVNAGGILEFFTSVDGAHQLKVASAEGDVLFNAAIGSGTPLAGLAASGTVRLNGNVTTNNGAITFANGVLLDADVVINSGAAATTFGGAIDSSCVGEGCGTITPRNLTASGGTLSFGGSMGGVDALANVSLTSASSMTLPSVTANTILARTTGASADLTLGPGTILTAFDAGAPVTLGAGRGFINDSGEGNGTIVFAPSVDPRWVIYSSNPAVDVFGGLNSASTAVWNTPFGGAVPNATSDFYAFAFQPTITVTSGNLTKSYGQDVTSPVAADFTISGLQPGVPGAFFPDTLAAITSGTPSVTSLGSPARAPVAGSPYAITVAPGSFAVSDNYALVLDSAGRLTVDPRAISYSVADTSSIFGTTPILGAATLSGVLPGDIVDPTVGAFRGLQQIPLNPVTPVGQYLQMVTALSNPDYVIAGAGNSPGTLTVEPTTFATRPFDPGFLPGLTEINNPAQTEYDVGGYEQVLPHFSVACNEPPSLPDPNAYSDPDTALRAISQAMENYFRRCQNPTQATIADALDAYAAKLQILAPRLPPALRNIPAIIAQAAKRVRAAPTRAAAVAVLRHTVAEIHKEIALVLSEDPQTRSREVRDGDVIAGALGDANVALVNSGGL
jgi:filamentous hemagglutinin family protein